MGMGSMRLIELGLEVFAILVFFFLDDFELVRGVSAEVEGGLNHPEDDGATLDEGKERDSDDLGGKGEEVASDADLVDPLAGSASKEETHDVGDDDEGHVHSERDLESAGGIGRDGDGDDNGAKGDPAD